MGLICGECTSCFTILTKYGQNIPLWFLLWFPSKPVAAEVGTDLRNFSAVHELVVPPEARRLRAWDRNTIVKVGI